MRLFNEDPNEVLNKHFTDFDSIAFSLTKGIAVCGQKTHDILILALTQLFHVGDEIIKDLEADGIKVIGQLNQQNNEIIKSLANILSFNRNTAMQTAPDIIHGRLWTSPPKVISFWNPADNVYKLKSDIINLIKNVDKKTYKPEEFQYEVDGTLMNYEEFLTEKKGFNVVDRSKVHSMTPGPERQMMQMKLGMGGSFGSRSPYHPDAIMRSRMSTSESFSFSKWIEATDVKTGVSTLDYHGIKPKRIYITDTDADEIKDKYYQKDPNMVAFLDYSELPDGSIYVHYVHVRNDQKGKGYMRFLIDHLYDLHKDAKWIDFGRIMHDAVEKVVREKMNQKKIPTYAKF